MTSGEYALGSGWRAGKGVELSASFPDGPKGRARIHDPESRLWIPGSPLAAPRNDQRGRLAPPRPHVGFRIVIRKGAIRSILRVCGQIARSRQDGVKHVGGTMPRYGVLTSEIKPIPKPV